MTDTIIDEMEMMGADVETDAEWRARKLLERLEQCRKVAEDEGVVVNGVRYSGTQGNRQALREALDAAAEFGLAVFDRWKDSDGAYHTNHPVSDVHEALRQIGLRRMQLIAQEGEFATRIRSGETLDVRALEWTA